MSGRVRTAITISSSEALPARSPRPLIVHSTWRAPFHHGGQRVGDGEAEVVVAVDRPDDLVGEFGMRSRRVRMSRAELLRHRVADGVGHVDRRAPASMTASRMRQRKSGSDRPASSAENSTSS
jgi:hypothetical protein